MLLLFLLKMIVEVCFLVVILYFVVKCMCVSCESSGLLSLGLVRSRILFVLCC